MAALKTLRMVDGEAWIAAGFIRNLVWDRLGGHKVQPLADLDVLIFDSSDRASRVPEQALEQRLQSLAPEMPWSVRNQARMHIRNNDEPYSGIPQAMGHWLETATGVAVRLDGNGRLEICAAYGLEDLFARILRPTEPGFRKIEQLEARALSKGWLDRWPAVAFAREEPAAAYDGHPFRYCDQAPFKRK